MIQIVTSAFLWFILFLSGCQTASVFSQPQVSEPVSLLQPVRTGEVRWGEPSGEIQVGIAANKLMYLPPAAGQVMGDPVVMLTCFIRNVSTHLIRILDLPHCYYGEAELEVMSHGQVCEDRGKGFFVTWPGPAPDSAYISLLPGQVHAGTLALGEEWGLPNEFEARVRFHYSCSQPGRKGMIDPKSPPRPDIASLWIAQAWSAPIRIKVGLLDYAKPDFGEQVEATVSPPVGAEKADK